MKRFLSKLSSVIAISAIPALAFAQAAGGGLASGTTAITNFNTWLFAFIAVCAISYLTFKCVQLAGEKIQWKGSKYHGTIVMTGEQPVGTFPCRQYHWTLKDPKTGQVAAERDGMYCEWQGGYSTKPSWNEVI